MAKETCLGLPSPVRLGLYSEMLSPVRLGLCLGLPSPVQVVFYLGMPSPVQLVLCLEMLSPVRLGLCLEMPSRFRLADHLVMVRTQMALLMIQDDHLPPELLNHSACRLALPMPVVLQKWLSPAFSSLKK